MQSIAVDYMNFVIKPLEVFKNKLINEYHLDYDDPLVEKIDSDLFDKYERLSSLIED